MTMMDLIGDLIGDDSPPVRHDSPNIRHAESRMDTHVSPDSPLSPDGGEKSPVRAYRWIVRRAEGEPRTVWLDPPGTAADALGAVVGSVTADPDRWLTVGCATCRHLSRPGLADGYCAKREDLQPVYGKNHPLRHLPADRGAACRLWEVGE